MRKGKRKKPIRITTAEAMRRLDAMVRLIREDVQIALSAEASLEVANQIVSATPDQERPGPDSYRAVHQSLALNLSISLARLFDHGSLSRHPNKRDVASIPLMVRLLRQKRCRRTLVERARQWTPMLPERLNLHEADCNRAIDAAISTYRRLANSRDGKAVLARLRSFRDKRLAHSLMVEALGALPRYNDIFQLMDAARDVADNAQLAIEGRSPELLEYEEIARNQAAAFWNAAFGSDAGITD